MASLGALTTSSPCEIFFLEAYMVFNMGWWRFALPTVLDPL